MARTALPPPALAVVLAVRVELAVLRPAAAVLVVLAGAEPTAFNSPMAEALQLRPRSPAAQAPPVEMGETPAPAVAEAVAAPEALAALAVLAPSVRIVLVV